MFSFITSFLPSCDFLPGLLTFESNPLDSFLQGLVGACGISVLVSLIRLISFLEEESWSDKERRPPGPGPRRMNPGLSGTLQFLLVSGILALVGSRVSSLVVLEFCLRAVSRLITAGPDSRVFVQQLLIQSQFSLGCALSCSLHFLHSGGPTPQRWLSLLLASWLSLWVSRQVTSVLTHVSTLYRLHSSQRYCGVCIGLMASGRRLQPALCRATAVTFAVAVVASVSIINQHFLSATEALRFWTPLTVCYTLLVVYMQDEQQRVGGSRAVLNTVLVRLGGLMVLMLTVGRWADVFHILICFLGEATCLIPNRDLLDAAASSSSSSSSSQDEDDYTQKREQRRRPQAPEK